VSGGSFPVVWLGTAAVITLPAEIDIANADQIREDLLLTLNRGAATLVVDMGGTTFCDSAGVNALVRAFKRASANSTQMRLVVAAPGVQRVLSITGVDHLIDVYPTVAASLAALNAAPRQNGQGTGAAGLYALPADPEAGGRAPQPG
jgi:anti-sigma B factor antagonist